MTIRQNLTFTALAILVCAASGTLYLPAQAHMWQGGSVSAPSITRFSSRMAFLKAVHDISVIDFEDFAEAGKDTPFGTAAGLRAAGVQFIGYAASGVPGELYVAHTRGRDWGTGATLVGDRFNYVGRAGSNGSRIDILLPVGVKSIGMNFMTVQSDGSRPRRVCKFKINTVAGSQVYEEQSAGAAVAFAGYVSNVPIRSVAFWVEGGLGEESPYGALDNVSFSRDKLDAAERERLDRKAIELNSGDVAAYIDLGILYAETKHDYAEAERMYKKAIEHDPNCVAAYSSLGVIYSDIKHDQVEAERMFRRIIQIDPNNSDAYLNLAVALFRQNKRDEAIVAARRAQELGVKEHPLYKALGF